MSTCHSKCQVYMTRGEFVMHQIRWYICYIFRVLLLWTWT